MHTVLYLHLSSNRNMFQGHLDGPQPVAWPLVQEDFLGSYDQVWADQKHWLCYTRYMMHSRAFILSSLQTSRSVHIALPDTFIYLADVAKIRLHQV